MKTKLFMGTRVTPELKACLEELVASGLKAIPFEGKEFVGSYLETMHPNVQQVREHYQKLTDALRANLHHARADTFPVVVFPQAFLG